MVQKIEQRFLARRDFSRGQQVAPGDLTENRRRGEIGRYDAQDRESCVLRIHTAYFPGRNGLFNGAYDPRVEGAKVLARDPRKILSSGHPFPLHEPGVIGMRREEIKIAS